MNKDELKEYNNEIRRMLQHEDNIRNQRTSWFLVLQGLLINGILPLFTNKDFEFKSITIAILLLVGTIISLSFFYAAMLSNEAYREGKNYWQCIANQSKRIRFRSIEITITRNRSRNLPPVSLLAGRNNYNGQQRKLKNIFLPYIFLPFFFALCEEMLLIIMYPHFWYFYVIPLLLIIIMVRLLYNSSRNLTSHN